MLNPLSAHTSFVLVEDRPASSHAAETEKPAKSDEEDDEDEAEAEAVSAAVLNEENEEDAQSAIEEEEHSLLDPPRSSIPQQPTQSAIPEEPQGPKPRLVIHKMALVNFKSYAGRQEIGPFHKVSYVLSHWFLTLTSTVVLLGNRRAQWVWQVEHYRRVAVCLRLPSIEDAAGKAFGTYPQFRQVP